MPLDAIPAMDLVRAHRENPAQPEIRAELTRRVERDGGWWLVGDSILTVESGALTITPIVRDPTRQVPSAINRGKYLDRERYSKPAHSRDRRPMYHRGRQI